MNVDKGKIFLYNGNMDVIRILSNTKDTLKVGEMSEFQGKLKHRSPKQIEALAESLLSEGLIMPFVIWRHDGKNLLLDGHGRYKAIQYLAEKNVADGGEGILQQDFPVLYVDAQTEEEAKKALLQISSRYGNVTRKGAAAFCATIPQYRAPVLKPFAPKEMSVKRYKAKATDRTILRVSVPNDIAEEVKKMLMEVPSIRVL